jgi:hypothetical protein
MATTPVTTGRSSRAAWLLLVSIALILSSLLQAQAPTPAPARDAQSADRLAVRRVVLYKSGVGYFEHLGRVRGNQNVTIDFTSGQLDDVLKSLTALDLDGGRVTNVGYNSVHSSFPRCAARRSKCDRARPDGRAGC